MIVLLASGTRGDIQPSMALAIGLMQAGRTVLLVTHPGYHQMASSLGIPVRALHGNPSEWMTHSGGQSALTYDGNWLRSIQATLAYTKAARPAYQQMLASAWEAVRTMPVEAVLFGLPTLWGLYLAEALGVPAIGAFLQPVSRTACFPSALIPSVFSAGKSYNRLTHRLVETVTWLPWRPITNRWRTANLGLKPAGASGPLAALQDGRIPVIYGFSPVVVPPAPDWPARHTPVGYWFLKPGSAYTPPEPLVKFIESGPPPVYIGFGSPGARDLHRIATAFISAVQSAGTRAVLDVDPSLLQGEALPASVIAIQGVPHPWLLAHMKAMVHHGGAGTTAAGLQAGLPALVVPMAVDQFFWAGRIRALQAGPDFIPQRRLTAERIAPALDLLVHDHQLRLTAGVLAGKIKSEEGVTNAVQETLKAINSFG